MVVELKTAVVWSRFFGEVDFPVNSGRSFKRAMLYARSEIDVEETS